METIILHLQDQQILKNLLKSKVAKEVEQQEHLDTASKIDVGTASPPCKISDFIL